MKIKFSYIEVTSEKLRYIGVRSHKIRATFYTENSLRKLLFKTKDLLTTGGRNYIVHEIDSSDWKTVHFGELKRFLKWRSDKLQNPLKNCDFENHGITKNIWEADSN